MRLNRKLIQSLLGLIIVIQSNHLLAQEKGIHFEQNLSWKQVQAKAKAERKYIFMDCYATWCVPCRTMDQKVYPDSLLGAYVNRQFISVKVQMDSTRNDNEEIRAWRNDANALEKTARINEYPSFLFFDPKGKLVYKEVGYHSVLDFLKMAMSATDPEKQAYTLLEQYREGTLYEVTIRNLINKMYKAGDGQAMQEIAMPYIHDYLLKDSHAKPFTKANLNLMSKYLTTSDDTVFDLFRQNSGKIDTIMSDRNFVFGKLFEIIEKEEFIPKLWFGKQPINKNPDWGALEIAIETKYGRDLAKRVIVYEKVNFYTRTEQWKELVNNEIQKVEKYQQYISNDDINNSVFAYFFMHSNDKGALTTAAGWMKSLADKNSNNVTILDTYANVLYKLGNKKEAIALEQKAHNLATRADDLKDTGDALAKMQANKPTWPTK